MDLVPRIDGEQVDVDKCSITRLYRVHVSSAKIAGADKVKTNKAKFLISMLQKYAYVSISI